VVLVWFGLFFCCKFDDDAPPIINLYMLFLSEIRNNIREK
jgi:hypothetical protein